MAEYMRGQPHLPSVEGSDLGDVGEAEVGVGQRVDTQADYEVEQKLLAEDTLFGIVSKKNIWLKRV